MSRPLRVAVIGAGPAGIYASDLLMKSDTDVLIDLYERMPAPFGLIRYGVAPDHPRIKGIVTSLHKVLDKPELRLLGNIDIGNEVTVDELREYYDAIIFSTGATGDRNLDIPGADLEGSFGAGEFVGFYDGNPDFERSWDLSAESVAVVGVGNVGLDVARILAKTGDELHVTEIPDNVYQSLKNNKAKEVHVFGRRGPAQAKFTPLELKELDHSPTIEVIVNPEDIIYDDASEQARRSSKTQDLVCNVLEQYAIRDPKGAPHKLYIHFFESPVEILGEDGHVVGIRTERTELDGNGACAAPDTTRIGLSKPSTALWATAPTPLGAFPSTLSAQLSPTMADTYLTRTAPSSPGFTPRAGSSADRSDSSATPRAMPRKPPKCSSPTGKRYSHPGRQARGRCRDPILDRQKYCLHDLGRLA